MKDQNQCTTQSATLPPFRGLTMILAVSTFARSRTFPADSCKLSLTLARCDLPSALASRTSCMHCRRPYTKVSEARGLVARCEGYVVYVWQQ
jgi:hypothetical protein